MQPLYFITESYPYEAQELSFLHAEVAALAEAFEVTLLPFRAAPGPLVEPLPEGVRVADVRAKGPLAPYLLAMLFQPALWRELRAARKGASLRGWLRRAQVIWVHGARALRYEGPLKRYLRARPGRGVVYCFWSTPQTHALARLRKRFPELKLAARAHGYDLYQEVTRRDWLPFRPNIDRGMDRMLFVCAQGKDYYLRRWGVPDGDKYRVSYLGCNGYAPVDAPAPDAPFTLISCSSVIPVKRVELLLQALASWPAGVPARWVHFGDGPLLPALRERAAALTAQRPELQIELRGRVPNASLGGEYAALRPHALANVSASEGLPVSMMEALSAGIPLLGLDVNGLSELITPETGALLPANATAEDIGAALLALAREPREKLLARKAAARALWEARYRAADCARRTRELLVALAEK